MLHARVLRFELPLAVRGVSRSARAAAEAPAPGAAAPKRSGAWEGRPQKTGDAVTQGRFGPQRSAVFSSQREVPWHVARNEQLRLDEASSVERQLLAKLAADGAGVGARNAWVAAAVAPCHSHRVGLAGAAGSSPERLKAIKASIQVPTIRLPLAGINAGFFFYHPLSLQSINQQALSHNYGEPRFSIASAFANRVMGVSPLLTPACALRQVHEPQAGPGQRRLPHHRCTPLRIRKGSNAQGLSCGVGCCYQTKRTVNMKTGGRRPTMNALVVVGNGHGAVGFGVGKASMMQEATTRVRRCRPPNPKPPPPRIIHPYP